MTLRFIDWIWHVRGRVALAPGQSSEQAFERLDPLFGEVGTSHKRTEDTLTFRKKDQPAQDKMSVFDRGVLRIEQDAAGPVLRYDLTSWALLFCFLAPLMFLIFAQGTILLGKYQKPSTEAAGKSAKDKAKADKPPVPLNPIDKLLGAPEPDSPAKKAKDKAKKDAEDDKPSPTPAYVFAGIFATLYVVGRVLEDRLVKRLFRRKLMGG